MKAYEIHPDDNWPHNYNVDATHKWRLPGVECPECGFVGGGVESHYPSLTLPEGIDPAPYLDGWPVSPERQLELQSALLSAWNQKLILHPGTQFGPLVGKASGKCGDVCWAGIGTVLLADHAVKRLNGLGVSSISVVSTEIKWRSKTAPKYFELDIATGLKLAPSYLADLGIGSPCGKCGLLKSKKELPDRAARLAHAELEYYPVLDATSLPACWDLLRVEDWQAKIVASERFRDAALKAELTNLTFREIKVLS